MESRLRNTQFRSDESGRRFSLAGDDPNGGRVCACDVGHQPRGRLQGRPPKITGRKVVRPWVEENYKLISPWVLWVRSMSTSIPVENCLGLKSRFRPRRMKNAQVFFSTRELFSSAFCSMAHQGFRGHRLFNRPLWLLRRRVDFQAPGAKLSCTPDPMGRRRDHETADPKMVRGGV